MEDIKYLSSTENIKKELAEHFNRITQKIEDGYEVISSEQDGCDEYGFMYWVECKNGWSGREHEISSKYKRDIFKSIQDICSKPITIYCKNIYIDDKIANICKNSLKVNNSDITILSEEEFLKIKSEILFLNRLKIFVVDEKKNYLKYNLHFKYPIDEILTSNLNNFVNSINISAYSHTLKPFFTKCLGKFISKFKDISKEETCKILYILDNLNK